MTNFLKSSEPMPPRLGIVVGVSIMGGVEILRLMSCSYRSPAALAAQK